MLLWKHMVLRLGRKSSSPEGSGIDCINFGLLTKPAFTHIVNQNLLDPSEVGMCVLNLKVVNGELPVPVSNIRETRRKAAAQWECSGTFWRMSGGWCGLWGLRPSCCQPRRLS